jgi:hypothetical protein
MRARTSSKASPAWYALRYSLPGWKVEESLNELIEYLPNAKIDEVILFLVHLDDKESTLGQRTVKMAKKYQKTLFKAKEAFEKLGIKYSLNPWYTVGHGDFPQNVKKLIPGFKSMVDITGIKGNSCPCPLNDAWRESLANVWRIYAETEPEVIWLEDDFRCFNHGSVKYGCFCPDHIKEFSKRIGKKITRQELEKDFFKSGKAHPWRGEYLRMQGEIMAEVAGILAKAVHEVSPNTKLGLMSSNPRNHVMEGRDWENLGKSLADGQALYSRPPLGSYSETDLKGLYYTADSIKGTRAAIPMKTIEQSEIENCPMTLYSKSSKFTFLQAACSFAMGCDGVTLNIYNSNGVPLSEVPSHGNVLGKEKKYLNALAKKSQDEGVYRGVKILHDDKYSEYTQLRKGQGFNSLCESGMQMVNILESFGIPVTYNDSDVVAVCGQILTGLSDGEIRELLTKGVLLDSSAAWTLYKRGFGKEIGLAKISEIGKPVKELHQLWAEEIFDKSMGGAKQNFVSAKGIGAAAFITDNLALIEPLRGAKVFSRFIDAPKPTKEYPAGFAFENKLGGRIIVLSHRLDVHSSVINRFYMNNYRQYMYSAIIKWLYKGKPDVMVSGDGVYPLAWRKDCEGHSVFGMFNLTHDDWTNIKFEFTDRRAIKSIRMLTEKGQWKIAENITCKKQKGVHVLNIKQVVGYEYPLVFDLEWK